MLTEGNFFPLQYVPQHPFPNVISFSWDLTAGKVGRPCKVAMTTKSTFTIGCTGKLVLEVNLSLSCESLAGRPFDFIGNRLAVRCREGNFG